MSGLLTAIVLMLPAFASRLGTCTCARSSGGATRMTVPVSLSPLRLTPFGGAARWLDRTTQDSSRISA